MQAAIFNSDGEITGVDLIVVEKFGELEQNGKGLIDEILLAALSTV